MKKYRPHIRSRHPSHNVLRRAYNNLPYLPFKSLIRLGSSTQLSERYTKDRVILNETWAIANSSNKFLMKNCFTDEGVKTADWWVYLNDGMFANQINNEEDCLEDLPYPIISKSEFGSRNQGNKKHDDKESLEAWLENHNPEKYIFEKYYNYNREYRLHVSEDGCFYTCRKMLKNDAPQEVRWYRNDANCVWVLEENELFDKPVNWNTIVEECVKALKSTGLDFGAIDLRVQSAKDKDGEMRAEPDFIVVEINSAPSFGEATAKKYIEELPKLLINKANN